MIGEQGEIFHIDFGHILDHSKEKMGVMSDDLGFWDLSLAQLL